MGTPASLLELIATGGSRRLALNAELTQRAAQAKQAEAAARHADAETEKANIEADAMRQAQADQQVFSEAFKHSANPKHIDAYIRANASGSGINAWQKASDEHQKSLLEMDEKRRKGEIDKAEQIGSIISSVMTLPADKRAAAWSQQVIPAIQQVDPSLQISPEYDEGAIPVMLGKVRYTKAAAEQADAIAKAERQRVDTANARQEGELKERAAFLQGVRPDMPYAEYKSLPGYEKFAKVYPSPAAAAAAAKVEGIAVKDRAKAAMDQQKLDYMKEGIDPEKRFEVLHQDMRQNQQNEIELKRIGEQARHNRMTEDETSKLTPEAKLKMAEMFATTGALPPLGMGKAASGMRSEIINLAAQRFPNVDFATQKAAFQANNDSLKAYQKQKDNIEGFEATAGKNLDNFLKTASKVVDSGSPFLNTPLRAIGDRLAGSPDQTAFNVARQVAVTEIAKVLNNPGGNAALSDSARHEVQELIGPNATLKQIYTAAKILRQDMSARKQAMDEQINAIKSRIQTPNGPNSPAASPGAKGDPMGVR